MRQKLIDVAKLAGVGHATVDRVLNQRGGVKPATAKKVIEAARELGVDRKLPSIYRQGLRFEVLLGRRQIPLCARMSDAFVRAGRPFEDIVAVERTFVDDTKPEALAQAILKSRSNALIVYGQEHELVVDAIAEVTSAGKPVVTIVSDVPSAPRYGYVGIDHYKAGRCAAFFLSRMASEGTAILLCSDLSYRAHAERVSGCRDGLDQYSGGRLVTELIEASEHDVLANQHLLDMLSGTNIAGIYCASANHPTLHRLLARKSIARPSVLIGHDLSGETERLLRDGTMTLVIDQNPDLQVRKALVTLALRFGLAGALPEEITVPFTIHVSDNIA